MKRIILIGYMGAGKTTIGRTLARELGLEFYDLDWYVENRFRLRIPEIFAQRGEEGFREIERKMLHEVAEFEDIVLSCGGGTPCFFDNIDFMNARGETIYLKASPEVLQTHLRMGKSKRPLIDGKSPDELEAYIRESLAQREPFYTQAKHIVPIDVLTTKENVLACAQRIIQLLNASPNA